MEHKLLNYKNLILGLTFLFASFTATAEVEDVDYFACIPVTTSCGETGIICNYESMEDLIEMTVEMEDWLCP